MLVNEIAEYQLKIQGREEPLVLRLDFKALVKMHKEYGNAFLLIYAFMKNNDLEVLPKLLRCMAQEEISEEEITNNLLINLTSLDTLSDIVLLLINDEVMEGSKFEVENLKNEKVKVEKKI